MAGIQYLDELFSAIRDTAEQLGIADSWMSRAENSSSLSWRTSFLQAAERAHEVAWVRFGEANGHLDALGPPSRLPSLLSGMPERLDELRNRLEDSEKRLSKAFDAVMKTPRGQA